MIISHRHTLSCLKLLGSISDALEQEQAASNIITTQNLQRQARIHPESLLFGIIFTYLTEAKYTTSVKLDLNGFLNACVLRYLYRYNRVMKINTDAFIGWFAPHQCLMCGQEGAVVCSRCMQSAGEPITPRCAGCKSLSAGYKTCVSCRSWLDIYAVYAAVPYDGVYEQLVHSYKFDVQRPAAKSMAQLMHETEKSLPAECIVCPLPTAPARIRTRGFDHAQLLSSTYARMIDAKLVRLLGRHTNNRQMGSSREQRIQQMKSEFYLHDKRSVSGNTIVLVDDVMTTGASLAGAARELKKAGAKRVYAVIFAQAG